jgi:outer membrane protein W
VFMPSGMTSQLKPYLIAGPSYYHISSDAAVLSGVEKSDDKWGLNAGVGFEYALSGFTTFLEARYNWIKTENSHIAFVPITVGIMFR